MAMQVQNVVILGSTGTIGINTLDVIRRHRNRFRVLGLSGQNNAVLLQKQIKEFRPEHVCVGEGIFSQFRGRGPRISAGVPGLCHLASLNRADIVVIGISGSVALKPFLSAARAGKRIAPANKEALVIAGEMIMAAARRAKAQVIPVDSEQSAIFQCLQGQDRKELSRVYLTASGGALADVPKKDFDRLTVRAILNHPRWKMGRKITVDSATLMNKGFEVIEACRLFDLRAEQIEVVIHPEAVIHSMLGFRDGSIMAQLAMPDMRLPIQYALTYPERLDSLVPLVDFFKLQDLTFRRPDLKKFPCLALAMEVAKKGGTWPAVLNAADEQAVAAFLTGEIGFTQIFRVVEKVVGKHNGERSPGLEQILAAEEWARQQAHQTIRELRKS